MTFAHGLNGVLCALTAAGIALAPAAASAQGNQGQGQGAGRMNEAQVTHAMQDWHPAAQQAVRDMTAKYGAPREMTESMAVWGPSGPWKRTVVYAQAVQHDFPMPHPDVLEQFVDYRVPPEMFDDLAMYDGSVIAERTKGELSARCDKEGANLLALNLAHEIVTGKRTVEEARRMYGEQIMAMKAGQPAPYTEKLMFAPMPNAADPDQPLPGLKGHE